MPNMICPFCKATWPEEFKWCMEDGAELEQNLGQYAVEEDTGVPGMECPECGARIDPRDEFCAGCGSRLQTREEAEAAVAQFTCPGCGGPVNPAEPFCGKCGARTDGAAEPDAAPVPVAAGGIACPNCGMQNTPADTFCGTCGQQLAAAPAPKKSAPAPEAVQNIICPQCSLELPLGSDYCHACGHQFVKDKDDIDSGRQHAGMGACPNCGMEIQPGDVFCGTCGYSMSGKEAAQPAPAPPASAAAQSCPNCGMETTAGDAICGTCGFALEPAAPAEASAPPAAPATSSCPNCGMSNDPGDTICGTCGFSLHESPEDADSGAPGATHEDYSEPAAPAAASGSCPNCGMAADPGDAICGTCGFELQAAAKEQAPAHAPAPPAPAAQSCPNCGMEVEPGEAFCGTCGTALESGMQDDVADSQLAPAGMDLDSPELRVSEAKLALRCPECGSTQTTRGGAFCDNCGAIVGADDSEPGFGEPDGAYDAQPLDLDAGVRAGDLADPFAAPPAPVADSRPMPSLADVTGSDMVCPECGVEGYPDMDTCATCGVPLVPQGELVNAAAQILHTPTPSLESLAAETPPAPPADLGPSLGDVTGDVLICSECGMEAPHGMREHDGCLGCGGELIKSKAQVAQVQESLYAPPPAPEAAPEPPMPEYLPPPPPMPDAAAPAGDEKICSCCGTPNPPETDFCAVCGVDFN